MPIIYQVTYYDHDVGHCNFWATSKKAAQRAVAEFRREDRKIARRIFARSKKLGLVSKGLTYHIHTKLSGFEIKPIVFPETKKTIVHWLNTYFDTDNG